MKIAFLNLVWAWCFAKKIWGKAVVFNCFAPFFAKALRYWGMLNLS